MAEKSKDTGGAATDLERLGARLAEARARGSVVVLEGLGSGRVEQIATELREPLAELGMLLLVFDPGAGESDRSNLDRVLQAYVREVDRRAGLSEPAMRLAEQLGGAADFDLASAMPAVAAGRMRAATMGQLWSELAGSLPAVLLTLNLGRASRSETERLEYLARYVFADPLHALTPEVDSWERAPGALVLVRDNEALPVSLDGVAVDTIDFRESAEASVRAFLLQDDIVRRFVDSTGGDVARLGEILEHLPENARHFLMYRYQKLEAGQQRILELLALTDGGLAPDLLHRSLERLDASEYFTRSLRLVIDQGFARRAMGSGEISVRIDSADFALALAASLDAQACILLHDALAGAELDAEEPDVVFLAEHLLGAGRREDALVYGLKAARRLTSERDFERARELLNRLAEVAETPDVCLDLHSRLVEVHSATGDYRAALNHCASMRPLLETNGERAALAVRVGHLLNRLSEHKAALEVFDEAIAGAPDARLRVEARLGRGEAAYALGRHGDIVPAMEALLEELDAAREQASTTERSHIDRATLGAQNLIGKVAIYCKEFDRASELFQSNRALAARWGWDEEVARAQANLGVVALEENDHAEALERLTTALQTSGMQGSLPRAYCLVNLAAVYQRTDDYGRALDHCLEAMRCAKRAGDATAYAVASRNLATLYQDMGACDRARAIVEHLREWYEPDARTLGGGWNLLVRGLLDLDQERYADALEIFQTLATGELTRVFGHEAAMRSAQAHLAMSHFGAAAELLQSFEAEPNEVLIEALRSLIAAELALNDGEATVARDHARAAHKQLRRIGARNDRVRARLVIARALDAMDRRTEALSELEQELQTIVEIAQRVPALHRIAYYAKPLHRQLVAQIRALEGVVPPDVARAFEAREEPTTAADAPVLRGIEDRERYADIVGEDPRLHQVFRLIDRVADSDATVLIYGESGTGKELIAEAMHRESCRSEKAFVKVNCAAFVENLLLSELFGHEKGAFTGAMGQKQGRFELADGGTIFLDEIGDISTNTQVALLRVLQERAFERVGGNETIDVDVRVVCATNRNLEGMVRRGEFRLDLYYRLKGVVIETPALRERRQDIPRLVTHFAQRFAQGQPRRFTHDVLRFLASYSWPGNVRELQNFVKSVLLFVEGEQVEMRHIEDFKDFFVSGEIDSGLPAIDLDVIEAPRLASSAVAGSAVAGAGGEGHDGAGDLVEITNMASAEDALVERLVAEGRSLSELKKRIEVEAIKRALIETEGNITRAADILQMKRPRLSQIINSDQGLTNLKTRLVG